MVIKSIIGKIKSINRKSDETEYIATIKEVKPIDNIVDDFFNEIDANNEGGANE